AQPRGPSPWMPSSAAGCAGNRKWLMPEQDGGCRGKLPGRNRRQLPAETASVAGRNGCQLPQGLLRLARDRETEPVGRLILRFGTTLRPRVSPEAGWAAPGNAVWARLRIWASRLR